MTSSSQYLHMSINKSVISTRFYYMPSNSEEYKYIVSASQDGSIMLTNLLSKRILLLV